MICYKNTMDMAFKKKKKDFGPPNKILNPLNNKNKNLNKKNKNWPK